MRPAARLTTIPALAAAAVLVIFNARRALFLAAALRDCRDRGPERPAAGMADDSLPSVLILAPMRNEAASLPGLAAALLALDYPPERLTIGLIDDASTDGSGAAMDALAAAHSRVRVLHNRTSLGKADSLNAGLSRWPEGEIVAVYDADTRPAPDSLRRIVAALADPGVAAAGGLIRPANGLASLPASYAALERLVHQQVTLRAKDRLKLAPAILGSNCAYRRADLAAAGGFPGGAYLEDSYLTLAFARRGRLTRFLPAAAASDRTPETLRGYWRQHVRWGRGFVDVATERRPLAGATDAPEASLSPALRLELTLFSLGYADRLALLAGAALWTLRRLLGVRAGVDRLLAATVLLNLALPYAQVATALAVERASLAWWVRLPALPAFFVIDAAGALWSAVLSLSRRPRAWQPTERTRDPHPAHGASSPARARSAPRSQEPTASP